MTAISIALTHIWSVLAEAMLVARNYPCSRVEALKITAVSVTPWFLIFSLFPLIGGAVAIGAVWSFTLLKPAIENICEVPANESWKIAIAVFLLWIGSYLFSNLFFAGVLAISGA